MRFEVRTNVPACCRSYGWLVETRFKLIYMNSGTVLQDLVCILACVYYATFKLIQPEFRRFNGAYFPGRTYFVQGTVFWEFNDVRMRVRHDRPRLFNERWLPCGDHDKNVTLTAAHRDAYITGSASTLAVVSTKWLAAVVTVLVVHDGRTRTVCLSTAI